MRLRRRVHRVHKGVAECFSYAAPGSRTVSTAYGANGRRPQATTTPPPACPLNRPPIIPDYLMLGCLNDSLSAIHIDIRFASKASRNSRTSCHSIPSYTARHSCQYTMSTAARRRLMRDFKVRGNCPTSIALVIPSLSPKTDTPSAHANRSSSGRVCLSSS